MSEIDGERIAALEAELAFQGETVRGLNEALAQQQQDLLLMQRQVQLLGEELRTMRERGSSPADAAPDAAQEKPPHY